MNPWFTAKASHRVKYTDENKKTVTGMGLGTILQQQIYLQRPAFEIGPSTS